MQVASVVDKLCYIRLLHYKIYDNQKCTILVLNMVYTGASKLDLLINLNMVQSVSISGVDPLYPDKADLSQLMNHRAVSPISCGAARYPDKYLSSNFFTMTNSSVRLSTGYFAATLPAGPFSFAIW